MHDFALVPGLVGGALIALALATLLVATGSIAGLSGIFAGFLGARDDWAWRAWFLAGMLAVAAGFAIARPATFDASARLPLWLVAIAGALVGFGTRASNGCTSGHGLCGMSRLSKRSIVATLTFFAVGVVTATITGRVIG